MQSWIISTEIQSTPFKVDHFQVRNNSPANISFICETLSLTNQIC